MIWRGILIQFDDFEFHVGRRVVINCVNANHAIGMIAYKNDDKWAVAITNSLHDNNYVNCVLCDESELTAVAYFSQMDLALAQAHEKTLDEYEEQNNE